MKKIQKKKLSTYKSDLPKPRKISKGAKYTPISKRQERPAAIIWLIKKFPDINDNEICKLLRTTKNTVDLIKNKTHWNMENIIAKSPIKLGLCNEKDIIKLTEKYKNEEESTNNETVKDVTNEKNEKDNKLDKI